VLALTGAALITTLWVTLCAGQLATRLRPMATASEHRSIVERGALQRAALGIIQSHPLTGVGAGNTPLAMLRADIPYPPQPVHNVPLLLAAELGVVGGGLWLWLSLAPGIALMPYLRRADPRAVASVGAWLALCLIGLWDSYPWALNAGRLLSASVLGLANGFLSESQEAWSRADESPR
jgi:O-antigen ligase